MVNSKSFPVYAFEKDDWTMFLVESPDDVLSNIEPIDLENNEYLFWDAEGCPVKLTLQRGKLTRVEEAENEITLHEAFARFSEALSLTIDTTGTIPEVWARLRCNIKPPSKLRRALTRILGFGCLLIVIAVAILVLIFLTGVIKTIFAG